MIGWPFCYQIQNAEGNTSGHVQGLLVQLESWAISGPNQIIRCKVHSGEVSTIDLMCLYQLDRLSVPRQL